jgi:pimeloyl-ACP methyl ester carboxylesterase
MSTDAVAPDTIVLIHGFWVTPRSWEHWITRYQARGYRVLAPAYPGFESRSRRSTRTPRRSRR